MIAEDFYQKRNLLENRKDKFQLKDAEAKVFKIISGFKIDKFLDIGCGDIKLSKTLFPCKMINEYYGLDISDSGVAEAKKIGITAVKVDIDKEKLPYQDEYFDFIFAGEVIEHLFDPDNLLSEARRTLKDGSFFMLTTPNLASWHNRIVLLLGYQPNYTEVSTKYNIGKVLISDKYDVSGHLRLFTFRALKELLFLYNFRILKVLGWGPMGLDKYIFNYIPSLSSGLIILCRKDSKIGK